MDGAAKFVRGDAIAALIITVINILGGLAIGLLRHGMSFADAAATFTTLTVGDGLVSQIPALLVSTAAGIVVTKGGMEGTADAALIRQLGSSPKPLAMAAGAAAVLALLPGLPMLPFLALAGARRRRRLAALPAPARPRSPTKRRRRRRLAEQPISETLRIDMIRLELGYGLLALAGGDAPRLTEQIKGLRRSIAAEMGFVLPPVRIQDNMQLGADTLLDPRQGDRGRQRRAAPDHAAGDGPEGRHARPCPASATQEPAFGLPALWIDPALREEAMFRGCTVVDPPSVLTTHLTEVVQREHGGAAVLRRDAEAARRAAARAAEAGRRPDPVADHRRRRAARAAERCWPSASRSATCRPSWRASRRRAAAAARAIPAHRRRMCARGWRGRSATAIPEPGGYIPLVTLSPDGRRRSPRR